MGAPIGPANARKLEALGCESAADVGDLDTRVVRKAMAVMGERLVQELHGVACLDLEEVTATRKGCAVTRSFSDRVEDLATMEQAIATHASRLGEKLRRGAWDGPRHGLLTHLGARPDPTATLGLDGEDPARSQQRHAGSGEGRTARRPADLAERLPLLQGRRGHDRPPAAPRLPAGDARPRQDRLRAGCRADGRARRLQPTLRARIDRSGRRRVRSYAGVVHEMRDTLTTIHDPARRDPGRGGWRSLGIRRGSAIEGLTG
ncbi:DNA polymerase IV [Methylobacterium cerastii]|uniref:DNA polymerase IV n=1 Tax=Methylobacterium cerastii TaxID=932741 RepID=A0ABQ4QP80_9HYPH|nr:DNA polymerase IV [Methylobacterium cerastii]